MKHPSDANSGREEKNQRFLLTLNKKYFFSKGEFESIYYSSSHPASLCGNPNPKTPIVLSISEYNCKVAKFLTSMLDPVISKDHCTKNLFSFCKEIKKFISTNKFLMSYEICSFVCEHSSQQNN